jgi:hypothetical protein
VPADNERIASLKRELRDLDARRTSIESELAALAGREAKPRHPDALPSENGRRLGAREKVALFRRLFAGRPRRFRAAVGESQRRPFGVRTGVPERVGRRRLRQAEDQV